MKKMKIKLIMMVLLMVLGSQSFGQWNYKIINSEFDGQFKKATTETFNNGYLTMEVGEPNHPFLALKGSYFCDEYTYIDLVLTVNGVSKKYVYSSQK